MGNIIINMISLPRRVSNNKPSKAMCQISLWERAVALAVIPDEMIVVQSNKTSYRHFFTQFGENNAQYTVVFLSYKC